MSTQPQAEHRWLDKLLGKWTYETEFRMDADRTPSKSRGSEVVRSLGSFWTIGEGEGEMPDGSTGNTILTLGFDPKSHRYIGTFIGSMMTHLWIYNGSLDVSEKVLTLDTEGPNFSQDAMTKYQDIIEFVNDDHRILKSQILENNGNWNHFMTAHYRRKQ